MATTGEIQNEIIAPNDLSLERIRTSSEAHEIPISSPASEDDGKTPLPHEQLMSIEENVDNPTHARRSSSIMHAIKHLAIDESELESFQAEEPKWRLCKKIHITKKAGVIGITKIFLLIGMLSYVIYQLLKYFNPNINRREYIKEKLVDTMPFAFFYYTYIYDSTMCNNTFGFYNGSVFGMTQEYHEWNVSNYSYDQYFNPTIDEMFDYVDNINDCKGAYIRKFEQLSFVSGP